MANSAVLTSHQNRRALQPNTHPAWKYVYTFSIEAGGGHAEQTVTVPVNGILQEAVIEVGTTAQGSETVNVDFDDDRDVEFSTNSTLAESSETKLAFSKPVDTFKIRVDPVDDPDSGDDWVIVVTVRGL